MKLRGIEFGSVLGASGVQGFFGEGYWFHHVWKPFGLDFSNVTLVAKTATLMARAGNMPLKPDYTPRNLFPGCVKPQFFRGQMVNAVGLSNPGLGSLLGAWRWQQRTKPFWLSIMSLGETAHQRLDELKTMVELIACYRHTFAAPFGVQLNLSCPNTGHDYQDLIAESVQVLNVAQALNVPIMPKYSIASAPIPAVLELNDHPACDAICVSNTVPFGWDGLDWNRVWGSSRSPLAQLGGGGLSGTPLQPLVCEWIARLRQAGFTKPINGGGGILASDDVIRFHRAGASSVFVGSVAMLRPWRVRSIVNQALKLDWRN